MLMSRFIDDKAKPIGPASGDLSGAYPSPIVVGIQTQPVDPRVPQNGDTLVYSGGEWIPTPSPSNTATLFKGTWDANANNPSLPTFPPTGVEDGYTWIVTTAGNTEIGGLDDWKVGDYIVYSGGQWYKLSNSSFGWTLTGNAGTTPNINYIGTSDEHDLSIRANAQEIIRVLVGGGIIVTGDITVNSNVVVDDELRIGSGIFYTGFVAGTQLNDVTYTLPSDYGTNNSFLVTDASGNLSWKAPITISAGTGLTGGGNISTDITISMPNVGTPATYGSASEVPVLTTDTQGRVSSVTNTSIAINGNQITSGVVAVANGGTGLTTTPSNGQLLIGNGAGFTETTLTPGAGISVTNGAGSITVANTGVLNVTASAPIASSGGANPNISLNNSGVVAGSYGTSSSVSTFTVNSQGLLTLASNTPIAINASQVTSGVFGTGVAIQNFYQNVSAAISAGSTTLAFGEAVYLKNSGGSANFPAVDRALSSYASAPPATAVNTIGLVSTQAGIPNNNTGTIVTRGVIVGGPNGSPPYLNTNAFTQGDILYVDPTTPGAVTNVKPSYPNVAIPVGVVVVRNQYQGAIYVDSSIGAEDTDVVTIVSPSAKVTLSAPGTTTISTTLFNGPPAISYLVLDFNGAGNVTLAAGANGPIQPLTANNYGRYLWIHNISGKTITFTAGGTTYLNGGVNLILQPNGLVQFMWSFVGGGAGRWIQMTTPVVVS